MKHISSYTRIVAPQLNTPPRRTRSAPSYNPDFDRYEREKADWIAANPDAPKDLYQSAMLTLASKCGI